MKKIINILILTVFSFYVQAQSYSIIVNQSTNGDTLLMPLLGVISGPLPPPSSPLPDITSQLQDIGVTSIRNNDNYDDKLDMEALFRCSDCFDNNFQNINWVPAWCCNPGISDNLHFEESDILFRAIRDGGFNLFFRLGGETQSGLPNQHHVFRGPQDTISENNWIKAAVPVVKHYDNFEDNVKQLDYLDIWTEWPNGDFWERSDEEFIWFFTKALDKLKAHFPDKKIGGPGFLVPTVFVIKGKVQNKATDLLTSLYNHKVKPDFISWHLWSLKPMDYYKAGENFRKLLDGTPPFINVPWSGSGFFDDVEIICGAWGTPKLNVPDWEVYSLYNKQRGAALLTADWIAMQETNTVRAYYYRDADPKSNPDTTIGDKGTSGMFYGDALATYKPKAYAFKLWSRLFKEFPQKLSCNFPVYASSVPIQESPKLWVLSAKNNLNAFGFLIANTDSLNKIATIDISAVSSLVLDTSDFDIYYYLVNDNENGDIEYQNYSNAFNIPMQTVVLVRILPKKYLNISSKIQSVGIRIFPNPVSNTLYIEKAEGFDVKLIDMSGKTVFVKTKVNDKILVIDVSNFTKGVYFIKLYNENQNNILIRKVIVF